ncbi:MAG: hypothetical protein ACRDBM_00485 [Sporomusa sp.]
MEKYYEIVTPGVGTVRVVVNHTDGLSEEEIARRYAAFHATTNRLYRQAAERAAAAHAAQAAEKETEE